MLVLWVHRYVDGEEEECNRQLEMYQWPVQDYLAIKHVISWLNTVLTESTTYVLSSVKFSEIKLCLLVIFKLNIEESSP